MGAETKIEWCNYTFNPWRGCAHVSPGCVNCYAETLAKRNPKVLGGWGPGSHRSIAAPAYWRQPLKWNEEAGTLGVNRPRVFCASLADVFEDHPAVIEARARLWDLIFKTPRLDWLLLTKRPENIEKFLPDTWGGPYGCRKNVWLGTSVEDRKRLPRAQQIIDLSAACTFLSIEPLLEYLGRIDLTRIGWVIVGGESGPNARPCDLMWIRSIVKQCDDQHVPCFVKQLGANAIMHGHQLCGIGSKGQYTEGWPDDLVVRQFPDPLLWEPMFKS
jgi:protein gp37